MSGKVLSILAFSLMLHCLAGGLSCQGQSAQKHSAKQARKKCKSQPSGNTASQAQAALPVTDPGLAYRGLTHDTVLAALRHSGSSSASLSVARGADIKFEGASLLVALWDKPGESLTESANRRDQKIVAVDLAEAINRHFPAVFDQFECSFFDLDAPSYSRHVIVKMAQLVAFNAGKLNRADFLNSVSIAAEHDAGIREAYKDMTYSQILAQNPIGNGPYAAERKELSEQLTTLGGKRL